MTEFEKKLLLSKEEYDYLMGHFRNSASLIHKPIVKQINYYFDTDDLSMNRQNITCRIRLKDRKYTGTIKSHSANGEHSIETEIEVRDGIRDNTFTDMGLQLQGEFFTYRCMILKDTHYEVVLDKNEYLGKSDYELEIEYSPEYEKDAQAIYRLFLDLLIRRRHFPLYKKGYSQKAVVPSKSKRFFERMTMNKQNKNK